MLARTRWPTREPSPSSGLPGKPGTLELSGAANFVDAKITNQRGQAGGFISRAWPIFWQVNQEGLSSGHTLATPGPLYGGQAFANTWQHAS